MRSVSLVCFFLKKMLLAIPQAVCSWRLWPLDGKRDQLVPASLEEVSMGCGRDVPCPPE